MGKMDKTEKYTVAGLCFGGSGVFLCEDAVVCAAATAIWLYLHREKMGR